MLYRVSANLAFLFFRYFFHLEVKGKNCIPNKGSFILASNHLSNLDPPLLASVCPRRLAFAAKKELFRSKVFALYLNLVGAVPIERKKTSIQTMRLLLGSLKVRPLLIFPEGTRRAGLENIQAGAGFLYKKSKVPVIAAKISGTDKFLSQGNSFFKKTRLEVVFKAVEGLNSSQSAQESAIKIAEAIKNI